MNTKQVLYNALKGQLDIKKQAYDVYNETTTIPACHELITNIRLFISSIAPINDSMEMDLNNRTLRIKTDNERYSNGIEIILNTTWKGDKADYFVDIEWNSGSYNLVGKKDKINHLNILHSLANNLESISDKFINEWRSEWNRIWDADNVIQKEYTDLQNALTALSNEIHCDSVDAMKEIGFEIKQFKPQYNLDWDYKDNSERVYKITTDKKSIKLQTGRSQWDSCYVEGFKVLGKKGNKYNVEVDRQGHRYQYDVLEKKFEAFIDDVASWEYKQADKYKADVEKRFEDRNK